MEHIVKGRNGQKTAVILKFKIPFEVEIKIKEKGLVEKFRSRNEEQRRIKRNAFVAQASGNKPFQYNRRDTAGNSQADSGIKVFNSGKTGNNLNLSEVWNDLCNAGYSLQGMGMYRKENDKLAFVQFYFEEKFQEGENVIEEIIPIFEELLQKNYLHVHIWDNPNSTVTINALTPNHAPAPFLRINKKGGLNFNF